MGSTRMTLISSTPTRRSHSVSSVLAKCDVRPGSVRRTRIEASSPEPRQFPFDLNDGTVVVEVTGDEPNWLFSTLDKLQAVSSLPENWDSYGGAPTTFEATLAALNFIARYLSEQAKEPTIVPATNGGIQLEWHRHSGDLEVAFSPEGTIAVYFVDSRSGDEWEMVAGNIDAGRLARAVDAVTVSSSN